MLNRIKHNGGLGERKDIHSECGLGFVAGTPLTVYKVAEHDCSELARITIDISKRRRQVVVFPSGLESRCQCEQIQRLTRALSK